MRDTPACVLCGCRCSLGDWSVCRSQRCIEAGQVQVRACAALSPLPMKLTAGLAPQRLRFSMSLQSSQPRLEQASKRSSWGMRCATFPRHYAILHSLAFALAPPPPCPSPGAGRAPLAVHRPLLIMGPPRRGGAVCPPLRQVVSVVVRLSPPVLRTGLHWLRGSGDVPVGCR